jgi:serine/threonine protein kinase
LKSATRYYHITHVLKQGGQGTVFRALGNDTYTCAIKQMLDRFTDPHERTQAVKRFKAEANILQRLRHPCIPNIYDLFEHQGYHYLVMEFVSGSDLEDLIRREGYIPEARALQWANQICDVLEYLHRQQIIFRDLKPSNIMIDANGNVKLIDFGIARVFQPVQAGTIIGTPGYAPPEQYQGHATPQSDIFALGATLHHMLTGRDPRHEPPFSFPPVYALRPDISRRTSDAIQKALQMKVEDRYTSVTAFRQALLPQSNPPIDPTIPLPGSQPPSVTPSSQKSSVASPSSSQKPVSPPVIPPTQRVPSRPARSARIVWLGIGVIAIVLVVGFLWMVGLIPPGGGSDPTPVAESAPTLLPTLPPSPAPTRPPHPSPDLPLRSSLRFPLAPPQHVPPHLPL